MAYPSIGRGYRRNRRDKAEKEESKDDAKKAAPRRATPGERARAMSAAVGLDTSPDAPKKRAARFGSGTDGMAKKPKTKMPAQTQSSFKSAKPKAAAKPVEKVNDLSRMSETKVTGVRRPNESQELQAKKPAVTDLNMPPKTPKIGIDGKAEAGPADMMRRKSATDTGMVAEKNPKSIAEAKKKGSDTFIGKDGRKKAAVTKEELEASGLSLRDYLNKQKGKTRKEPAMKKGGDVAKYAFGGSVRGSGCATKGVRAAKMVTMKGS